jgi:hypothetical protein
MCELSNQVSGSGRYFIQNPGTQWWIAKKNLGFQQGFLFFTPIE